MDEINKILSPSQYSPPIDNHYLWLIVCLCPIIGQIFGVYLWFTGYPRKTTYFKNTLILCSYFTYLIILNWDSDIWWKRHLAQTIGGLIIFKILYELINQSRRWIYLSDSRFYVGLGYFIMIVLTGGLYLMTFIYQHWDSPNRFRRHLSQTIGGLIIFKLWYEMFRFGKKWIYCKQPYPTVNGDILRRSYPLKYKILGHVFLIASTFGCYILYRIIELIIIYWSCENHPWKRHLAQFIGGLIIFKIYFEMVDYGLDKVYFEKHNNIFQKILGNVFLVIISLGLFIPYRLIELIVYNFDSPVYWKKHMSQTIVGLVVFKLWYELFMFGYVDYYRDKNVLGFFVLTFTTCGLFLIHELVKFLIF